jgi:hypothetical protein
MSIRAYISRIAVSRLTLRRRQALMHGVAPRMCGQGSPSTLGGEAGGRSPVYSFGARSNAYRAAATGLPVPNTMTCAPIGVRL